MTITRSDAPYMALILIFQAMTFGAGYYAAMRPATTPAMPAPILVTVQSAAPAPVDPQLIAFVQRSMTPVPVEQIPDAGPQAPPVRVHQPVTTPAPKHPVAVAVQLEDDPIEVLNPYRASK